AHELDLAAIGPAEKAAERQLINFSQSVEQRNFDRRLGHRMAVAHAVKPAHDFARVLQIHADERRREIFLRHELHRLESLIGIARPALSSFAPAFDAVVGLEPDDERAAVLEKSRGAAVNFPDRQHQRVSVDGGDLHPGFLSSRPMAETSPTCSRSLTASRRRASRRSGSKLRVSLRALASTSVWLSGFRGVPLK